VSMQARSHVWNHCKLKNKQNYHVFRWLVKALGEKIKTPDGSLLPPPDLFSLYSHRAPCSLRIQTSSCNQVESRGLRHCWKRLGSSAVDCSHCRVGPMGMRAHLQWQQHSAADCRGCAPLASFTLVQLFGLEWFTVSYTFQKRDHWLQEHHCLTIHDSQLAMVAMRVENDTSQSWQRMKTQTYSCICCSCLSATTAIWTGLWMAVLQHYMMSWHQ
jgi:hypothetical protein